MQEKLEKVFFLFFFLEIAMLWKIMLVQPRLRLPWPQPQQRPLTVEARTPTTPRPQLES